jgi:hypothetical protein
MTHAVRTRRAARRRAVLHRLARLRVSRRGQTTTEYLMISGFATALGLFVMRVMQLPFQKLLGQMVSYVINNSADLPW